MNPYEEQLCQITYLNKTQQKICDAFLKIYKDKEFENITIKEICQSIPIARTTFYQYYNNIWEVKEDIESNFVAGLLKNSYDLKFFDYNSDIYNQYLHNTILFLKENQSLFYTFLVLRHDYSFYKKYKISIKYHYYDLCHGDEVNLEIIAGYLISIFSYYLENHLDININSLEKYLHILQKIIYSLH